MRIFLGSPARFLVLASLGLRAGTAHGVDVRANHCEIFVDKVEVRVSALPGEPETDSSLVPWFHLKILTGRLDSPVARVGAVGRRLINGSPSAPHSQEWLAEPFASSTDYFSVNVGSFASVSGHAVAWEGAFYVETATGKRLWANNSGPNPEFVVTRHLVETVRARSRPYVVVSSSGNVDVGSLPKTADFFADLNPSRCR